MNIKKRLEEYLRKRGWSQWYHDDYWVNHKLVENIEKQDFTNYGLFLPTAIVIEYYQVNKIFKYWFEHSLSKEITLLLEKLPAFDEKYPCIFSWCEVNYPNWVREY